MQKINLRWRVGSTYNSPAQVSLMSDIEREINRAADGYLFPVMPVTTTYTMSLNDAFILCDASNGAFTVTLKPAAECVQKLVIIKKIDNTATVTVNASSSETIDGATSAVLTEQYESICLMANNDGWWIV